MQKYEITCCFSDCFRSFCSRTSRTVTEVRKLTSPELLQVLEGPSTCGDLQRVFARALRDGVEGWMLGVIQNLFRVGEKQRMIRDTMTCFLLFFLLYESIVGNVGHALKGLYTKFVPSSQHWHCETT